MSNSEETNVEETVIDVLSPGEGSGSDLTDVSETMSSSEKYHGTWSVNLVEVKLTPYLAVMSVDHTCKNCKRIQLLGVQGLLWYLVMGLGRCRWFRGLDVVGLGS